MRLGAHAETFLERLAFRLNLGPKPLADTQAAFQFARIIMAASKAGLFEALHDGGRTAQEIAAARSTDPQATEKVLDALLVHRSRAADIKTTRGKELTANQVMRVLDRAGAGARGGLGFNPIPATSRYKLPLES